MNQAWQGRAAALLGGVLAPFSLAPYNIWPAGIASLIVLLAALNEARPKEAALRGWLYGLGLFGVGTSWVYFSIHDYGYAPVPLALALTSLFSAFLSLVITTPFAYCYARMGHAGLPGCKLLTTLLGFPALWVLFEWVRAWLLTGFPWLYLGYGHIETSLAGWAPVLGVYGLSFMVAFMASAIYVSWQYRAQIKTPLFLVGISTPILLWAAGAGLNQVEWTQPKGETLKVTLLQPNITQDVKWQPEQRQKTLELLYRETSKHLDSDLVVWPENAVPVFYHQAQLYLDSIAAQAKNNQSTIITGLPYWEARQDSENGIMHNSITAVGNGSGLYHKQKLVPFGEFVPLQSLLRGLIQFFNLPMSDFRSGPVDQAPLSLKKGDSTIRVAPYICYEIVYPDFVRKLAAQSELLLTISDDSWFGTSIGPHQHLEMAQMRALENGRYLVRSTNTGITAIVDHKGLITEQAPQFEGASLTGDAQIMTGITPYGRFGSWPILLLCGGLTLMMGVLKRKR